MWIFTRYGFFSIACASQKNGHLAPDTFMVRARQRRHLENLIKRFPDLTTPDQILQNSGTDYRYRIIVSKLAWTQVLTALAEEQAWSNFKGETERFLGQPFHDYTHALHRVWHEMYALQQKEPK